MSYDLRLTTDTQIEKLADFLLTVFSNKAFNSEYLNWQYLYNPRGKVLGFDAYDQEKLCAHYATIPILSTMNGKEIKGLLSLNTAVSADHAGKGLFTTLALKTYKEASNLGYHFIIGVSNRNSTYGFINKLGFKLVGPLQTCVSMTPLSQALDLRPKAFKTIWDSETLNWRLSKPGSSYLVCKDRGRVEIRSNVNRWFTLTLKSFDERAASSLEIQKKAKSCHAWPPYLYVGTNLDRRPACSFEIPLSLRPSPLNLIFKPLSEECILAVENGFSFMDISFDTLDFDAF